MSKFSDIQLARYLKDKRRLACLSQKDVSDKLGYNTSQFISNWERGKSHPPILAIKKLAELYNISADDLFEILLNEVLRETSKDLKRKFSSARKY